MLIRRNHAVFQITFGYIFVLAGMTVSAAQVMLLPLYLLRMNSLHNYLNKKLTYMHWSLVVAYGQRVANLKVNVWTCSEDLEKLRHENSILIANHKYQADWITLWYLGEYLGILQNFKTMAKHALLYVPVIGWQFWLNDYILVKRRIEDDRRTLQSCFKRFASLKNGHFWLTIFCEGTRFTEKKHEASVKFAKSKGIKPLKHHLVPRTRGFSMLANGMRDFIPSAFDATICFNDQTEPTLVDILKGVPAECNILLRRIPIEEIPEEEKECGKFLVDLYHEKDDLCEHFQQHQRFPTDAGEKYEKYVKVDMKKSTSAFLVLAFWFVVLVLPLLYMLSTSGTISSIALAITAVLSTSQVMNFILGNGRAKSTYGQQ